MLKYAFMSFSAPELSLSELLQHAAACGYQGVEPRLGHAHGIAPEATAEERKMIRQRFADAPVACCCLASQGNFTDPASRAETVELNRRVIALARDLACPRIRIFGGLLPEGMGREQAIDELAATLRPLAAEAGAAGVVLCLETHDGWCHPDHVATLMERVRHAHLRVNWDMMHPTRACGVPVEEGYARLRQWIAHVHIHDGLLSSPLTFRRCGEGELDMRAALTCLVRDDYEGYVSGEWINAGDIIDLADERQRLQALEAEIRQTVMP